MLKELTNTILGASIIAKQKMEEELKVLEGKGKIKKSDVKDLIKSFEKKGKAENKRIKKQMKSMMKEIINELGLATKKDLMKLEEELKKLNKG